MTISDRIISDTFDYNRKLYKLGGTDHHSIMGGYADVKPKNNVSPESGYVTEENFMKLYCRELG